jgi:hypothetical protein
VVSFIIGKEKRDIVRIIFTVTGVRKQEIKEKR